MTDKDEHKFDLQIRAILENAREDVPDGVWSGIEERLSEKAAHDEAATGKRKIHTVPVWFRISSGAAAAAAVAAGLFISGIFDDSIAERQYDSMADASGSRILSIREEPWARVAESLPDMTVRAIGETRTALPADTQDTDAPEVAQDNAPVPAPESAGNTGTPENTGNKESGDVTFSEDDTARWEALLMAEEPARNRIRTSITLSGNAISNTNASVSRNAGAPVSFSPGKNTLTKDMISESSESSFSVPVSFGVGVKIDFTERWALGAGVNYTHLRRNFAGWFYDVEGDSFTENYYSNILNSQDYIGIPVNVYFSILKSDFIDFYAYAGGTAEKCLSDKYLMTADGYDIHHRESVRGMQFSANAGLGMEFIIADTFGIYIDPSLRYYFPDADQPRSIRTVQPLMFGLELGFRIRL